MPRLPLLLAYLLLCLVYPLGQLPRASGQELEHASFGSTAVPPSLNWTRFWQVFNAHSAWDLEYNDGSGWVSRKSDLQIVKNYSRLVGSAEGGTMREYNMHAADADAVKIGLNFTASFTADYRLTFVIDLDVRNYSHREGSWNYTLSYQNHTVYFDWSDIQDLPLDAVNHGVMPVGDESFFWFRLRKNAVAAGTTIYIDPSFGDDTIEATLQNWSGSGYAYRNMAKYTPTDGDGTLDSITVYVDFSEAGTQNMSCAFYFAVNTSFIAASEIREVSGDDWYQFDFTGDPVVKSNVEYGLTFWGEDDSPTVGYRYASGSGEIRYASDQTGWPSWPDPFTGTNATRLVSIYANYTLSAAGQTYYAFPAVNITLGLGTMRTFYGLYMEFPSIAVDFALASTVLYFRTFSEFHAVTLVFGLTSTLNHITASWTVNPAIIVDFDVGSMVTPLLTYVQSHAVNVVFAVSSLTELVTGVYNVNPAVNVVFSLASAAAYVQHHFYAFPGTVLNLALSSTATFVQHLYTVTSSIVLRLVLAFFSPQVSAAAVEVSTSTAGFAIIALAIALCALALVMKQRKRDELEELM